MIIAKIVAATATAVAAGALSLPAAAPVAAAGTTSTAVSNVSYSVPASWSDFRALDRKHRHRHHDGNGGNVIQAPIQACGNNIGNNIGIGIFGHGSAKGGNNNSKCSQHTSSH